MLVIADTTPLNHLVLIDLISVLPTLYGRVVITPAVVDELSRPETPFAVREWFATRPPWLEVRSPLQNDSALSSLDAGEREAIILAIELGADQVLMDEHRGRRAAVRRGLTVTETLAILAEASHEALIDFDAALRRLRQTNFRFSEQLAQEVLRSAGPRRPGH